MDPVRYNSSAEECLEKFNTPDFVMEPKVFQTLDLYIHCGGDVAQAINALSNSYVAEAQTANLLAEWLLTAECDIKEVNQTVEENLKRLIIKHFDPQKADLILNMKMPSWINDIITFPTWRALIYKLAEDYPDCRMLNHIVKLCSDAGYQTEMTGISTASHQLEIFNRILKTSITGFLENGNQKLNENLREFIKSVCHSEYTFFYTQALLFVASLEAKGGAQLKRLSQEIYKYAREKGEDPTQKWLALNRITWDSRACTALSNILEKDALNPIDISVLCEVYESEDPPPVNYLRNPQFIDLLIDTLFHPGRNLEKDYKAKCIYLLAYSSAVHENYKKASNVQSFNNMQMRKSINRNELNPTIEALEKISTICLEKNISSSEILHDLSLIFQYIGQYTVIAHGVVHWVKIVLEDPSYFRICTETTPLHMILLDEVTACHTVLHNKVLEFYIYIFEKEFENIEVSKQLEIKKMILDRMVHLLEKGCVMPVMNYIRQCVEKKNTDNSLLRHFITETLHIISPPYSEEFMEVFLPMCENQEVTSGIKTNTTERGLLTDFIEACKAASEDHE